MNTKKNRFKSIRDLRRVPVRTLRAIIAEHTAKNPGFWPCRPISRTGCHLWLTDGLGHIKPQYLPYFDNLPEA